MLVEAKTLDSRTMIGTKACQEEEDKEAIVGLLTGEITEEAEEEEVVDEIDEIQFFLENKTRMIFILDRVAHSQRHSFPRN